MSSGNAIPYSQSNRHILAASILYLIMVYLCISKSTPASRRAHSSRAAAVGSARIELIILLRASIFFFEVIPLLYRFATFRKTLYVAKYYTLHTLYVVLG